MRAAARPLANGGLARMAISGLAVSLVWNISLINHYAHDRR